MATITGPAAASEMEAAFAKAEAAKAAPAPAAPAASPSAPAEVNPTPTAPPTPAVQLEIGGGELEPRRVKEVVQQTATSSAPAQTATTNNVVPFEQAQSQPHPEREAANIVVPSPRREVTVFEQRTAAALMCAAVLTSLALSGWWAASSSASLKAQTAVLESRNETLRTELVLSRSETSEARRLLAEEQAKPWWKRLTRWW